MGGIDFKAHHLGLSVPDVEASIRWYGDFLGFAVEKRMEIAPIHAKIALLKRGDFRLELYRNKSGRWLKKNAFNSN